MRAVRLALAVLSNRLGAVPRPSWCTFLVTYRCNARCQMCDSWRIRPGDELTVADVAAVFAKIGRLDVVRLTGGEPFLRDDLLEIAETVRRVSAPLVIHITTNGSFPQRVVDLARQFSKPSLLRFMVSFDGLADEHDRNRGKDVTFELAMATVRYLAELRSTLGLEVSANHTVISPRSLEDHAGLRRMLGELDVDVHSVLAYEDSAMYGAKRRGTRAEDLISTRYPLHPLLNGADVLGFIDRELTASEGLRNRTLRLGKRYYLHGLHDRLNGAARPRFKPPCVALRSHVRLLPDGRVPVCQFNTQTVGNLLTETWEQVWHGSAARASRAWVDACVGCWAECEVMPSAIYTADIVRSALLRGT
ncbi:MAG: 7-carboxy-7-deazaguanine synthase [Phycisphaerae bacterium]|nr:7-carboxy-7-deazaguanine synthase [Phycisphaerae bacterium]